MLPALGVAAAFSVVVSVFPMLLRSRYLLVLSAAGAAAYYGKSFPGFVAVVAVAYLMLRWLSAQTLRPRRWRMACAMLLALATVFTLGRVLHWNEPRFSLSGVRIALFSLDMWLALRLVTAFWEVGSGMVADLTVSKYLHWICLPLTLAGPLLRLSQFPGEYHAERSFWSSRTWWRGVGAGAAKLTGGLALAGIQRIGTTNWPSAHVGNALLGTLLTGPVGFYLVTAGFFQIMEQLGKPSGFKIPESFCSPIGRRNISEFWMNWNMTATFVFRDYLFYNRWGRRSYNIYFNTLLLFTLVGLWHAANGYWVLWGFLHGVLFCIFLLWKKQGKNLMGLPLRGTRLSDAGSRVFTYLCVCACWYLPSKILQKVGAI